MTTKTHTLEERVLAEVREQWTPPEATLTRLRASLDARIHDPGALMPHEPTAPTASLGGVKSLLVTAVASAAVAFAAGYWLGQASPEHAPERPRMAPQTAPHPDARRPQPAGRPQLEETTAPAVPETPRDPSPTATPPKQSNSATPRARELAPPRESAEVTYKDPLDTEVDLLRRVEHALRQGNGRLAVALLRELDDTVPEGQLRQERTASHIMADCINASLEAKANAARYLEQNSKSPFAARVRVLCDSGNE